MFILTSQASRFSLFCLQLFLSSRKQKRWGYILPLFMIAFAFLRQLLSPNFFGYFLSSDLLFAAFLFLEYLAVSTFTAKRGVERFSKKWFVLPVLLVLFIPLYIMFTVTYTHHTIVEQAQKYPETESSSYDGKYLLKTEVTKEKAGTYASFSICDPVSREELYQCPKYYRTMDLKKIDWLDDSSYDIEVFSGDTGTDRYLFNNNTWKND